MEHSADIMRLEFARLKPLFLDNITTLAPYYARFFPLPKVFTVPVCFNASLVSPKTNFEMHGSIFGPDFLQIARTQQPEGTTLQEKEEKVKGLKGTQ